MYRDSFSIGVSVSSLVDNIIPPFRPSSDDWCIDEYLHKECISDRMSGPFSEQGMHALCNGPFTACPVHVITTEDDSSKVKHRVVHNISFQSSVGFSVNDLVDLDDFPMEWGTASKVAEIVSSLP